MLVLSRKVNESIRINDDITIVVVEIRGDKVRLGIQAPKDVVVHRQKVFDTIKRSEAMAAITPKDALQAIESEAGAMSTEEVPDQATTQE